MKRWGQKPSKPLSERKRRLARKSDEGERKEGPDSPV